MDNEKRDVAAVGERWTLTASIWEDSDYVITIRPLGDAHWRAMPIGCALSKSDAMCVLRWLPNALHPIMQIAQNLMQDRIAVLEAENAKLREMGGHAP